MTERRNQASILLGIATPLLAFGIAKFEIGGGNSSAMAIFLSISITGGIFCALCGLVMLFTKVPLGIFDEKPPKPIKEEKEMETNEEEEYVEIDVDTAEQEGKETYSGAVTSEQTYTFDKPVQVSESIGLMKREKELQKKCNELTSLLEEADIELRKTQEKLNHKGWISTEKGWVIE